MQKSSISLFISVQKTQSNFKSQAQLAVKIFWQRRKETLQWPKTSSTSGSKDHCSLLSNMIVRLSTCLKLRHVDSSSRTHSVAILEISRHNLPINTTLDFNQQQSVSSIFKRVLLNVLVRSATSDTPTCTLALMESGINTALLKLSLKPPQT